MRDGQTEEIFCLYVVKVAKLNTNTLGVLFLSFILNKYGIHTNVASHDHTQKIIQGENLCGF